VYGNYCGRGDPQPGCNYYHDGSKIVDVEDPYYRNYYHLDYALWEYTDTYGYTQYYLGWAWWSPDNVLYDEYGRALNELGGSTEVDKDMIAQVGEMNEAAVKTAGKDFAARYALAEDKGVDMARVMNDWATLAKSRSRTTQDIEAFSKRLGVDLTKVTIAMDKAKTGDNSGVKSAINDVSAYWGTTPETAKEILKNAYKDSVGEYNID